MNKLFLAYHTMLVMQNQNKSASVVVCMLVCMLMYVVSSYIY